MKIGICSDHAAFELKEFIKDNIREPVQWIDYGCPSTERVDYPDYVQKLCKDMLKRSDIQRGVILCGTGIGASMAANRFRGIRAALCYDELTTELARKHNNANVLAMGGRMIQPPQAVGLIRIFLDQEFEAGRHENRIKKIENFD